MSLNARVKGNVPSRFVERIPHAPVQNLIRDGRLDVIVVARVLLHKIDAPTRVRLSVDALMVVPGGVTGLFF